MHAPAHLQPVRWRRAHLHEAQRVEHLEVVVAQILRLRAAELEPVPVAQLVADGEIARAEGRDGCAEHSDLGEALGAREGKVVGAPEGDGVVRASVVVDAVAGLPGCGVSVRRGGRLGTGEGRTAGERGTDSLLQSRPYEGVSDRGVLCTGYAMVMG